MYQAGICFDGSETILIANGMLSSRGHALL